MKRDIIVHAGVHDLFFAVISNLNDDRVNIILEFGHDPDVFQV
jgi:hypothetical protein